MLPVGFEPTRDLTQKLTKDALHLLKTSPLDLSGIAAFIKEYKECCVQQGSNLRSLRYQNLSLAP